MSNVPMGYSEPVTIDDIELESITGCVKYIVENEVKFRYEGDRNLMAWWDNKGNQGKDIDSLVMMVRGLVENFVEQQ